MDDVRLPRLLQKALDSTGNSLKEVCRLHPISLSVELNLYPLSRATMVLSENDPAVKIHDFVELFSQNGSLGVFRVVNVSTTYKKQRQLQLNHALDVFADALLPGEMTISGTVQNALSQIVAAQTANLNGTPYWQLGTCADTNTYNIDVKYTNAMQCLTDLAKNEEDYYFTFDFSRFPWVVNFVARTDIVLSEFRLPRNVESCQITLDDTDLCTKLYLSVDTTTAGTSGSTTTTTHEIHEDTAAQAVWGIVAKTAGIKAEAVPDKAAWVQQYFKRHSQPTVQISITGAELNRLTGETFDEIHLGCICRVALPDYDTVFNERIVSYSYSDVLRNPMRVTVSLANKKQSAEGSFAGLSSTASSAASAASENSKKIQNNNTQTQTKLTAHDEHITDMGTILHEAGLEIDAHGVWLYASEDGPNYALGASFKVQSDAITSEVNRATTAEGTMNSRITQTSDAITEEVTRAKGEETALSSRLTITADAITTEVTHRENADQTLSSQITQNANQIALKVNKGNVSTQLAIECGNVTISGGNLVVDGYVTSAGLKTTIGNIDILDVKGLHSTGNITADKALSGTEIYLKSGESLTSVSNAVSSIGPATASGGKITIPWKMLNGKSGTDVTFNIADTQYYKDGVASAKKSVTIESVNGTATPNPQFPNYQLITMTATASNGATGTNTMNVLVNPTINQCYTRNFSVSRISKYGEGYEVVGSVYVRVEFSDGTHTDYGPYTVRDIT